MNNTKKIILPLLLAVSALAFRLVDKNVTLQQALDKLSAYMGMRPQEKLYVHLNKPLYATGEDLWFKTYLVHASSHSLDSLSRTVYVELINSSQKVISRKILYSPNGVSHGDFHLGDSLPGGNYVIRAYTNFMKNEGEDFFFMKEFSLVSADSTSLTSIDEKANDIDLQFFPEGGNLVACGVLNRVAFKAIDQRGKPANVEGEILDEGGQVVSKFVSQHDGMGVLQLLVTNNSKYKARVTKPSGVAGFFLLPDVVEQGFLMQVYDAGKNVKVIIYYNHPKPPTGQLSVNIIAHTRGMVGFAAQAQLAGAAFFVNIPKSKFPEGVSTVSLLDSDGTPQCERLFFIRRPSSVRLGVSSNKPVYGKREKIELEIQSLLQDSTAVPGNFSVSVYNKSLVKSAEEFPFTIENYLLLTSDLKGYIHQPGYYFKDSLPQTKSHLDLLMMTHGWRRFTWQEVLKDSISPPTYFVERGITVSGQVSRVFSKKPANKANIKILTMSGGFALLQSDSLGKFYSDSFQHFDSTGVVIQTENSKGRNEEYKFFLDPFNPSPDVHYQIGLSASVDTKEFLNQANKQQQIEKAMSFTKGTTVLNAVEVKAKRIENKPTKLLATPDQTLDMSKFKLGGLAAIFALQGRVPGLTFQGMPPNVIITYRNRPVKIFLNGTMPMDMQQASTIPANDVESIEILRGVGASIYGVAAVVSINLNQNAGARPVYGMHTIKYPGYYKAREFYTPRYDKPEDAHKLDDFRTALYWNPIVETDDTGKANLSFFGSDVPAEYLIVVEGIASGGHPVFHSSTFKIQ